MGAHGRLARLCAVGGVAATSFALVKVPDYQQRQTDCQNEESAVSCQPDSANFCH